MFSAQDKEQVQKWSERQLGLKARLVSISEEGSSKKDGFVEKGGTGITAMEADGCKPVLSIMADFVKKLSDAEDGHMESDQYVSGPRSKGMMPTIH